MVEFLEILGEEETIAFGKIDHYWRSHPISGERIAALRSAVEASPYKDRKAPTKDWIALERMQAKLYGFTKGLRKTLRKYPVSDQSLGGRYARSIAYFKYPDLEKGLKEIDSLLAEYPSDPYFHELKGQMLFENGDPYGAIPSLKIATDVAPYQPLILTLYGTVLLATGDNQYLNEAIRVLKTSSAYDPYATNTWNQMAIAYNRLGDVGNLSLATAERFALLGKWDKAIFHAKRVQENMSAGAPGYLRADDIISIASRRLNK